MINYSVIELHEIQLYTTRKNWKQPLCYQDAYFQVKVSDLIKFYIIHIFLRFYLMILNKGFLSLLDSVRVKGF